MSGPFSCTPEDVAEAAHGLDFMLDGETAERLAVYLALLGKWNRVMNLVGPSSWREILSGLVADSLYLAAFLPSLPLPERPFCRDFGAGAGLPGLPLRMLWQRGDYVLVEAREKRALFLQTCLAAVPLPGVEVYHGRAERFLEERGRADLTVSRAFLPWEKVLALIEKYSSAGELCLFLAKSPVPAALPPGWEALAEKSYGPEREGRCFWVLRRL